MKFSNQWNKLQLNLNNLYEKNKEYVNGAIISFKKEIKENELVLKIKKLLNQLPKSRSEIESLLKSYDNDYDEDEYNGIINLDGLQLFEE